MDQERKTTLHENTEHPEGFVLCPVCGEAVNNHAAEELYTVDYVESDFRVRTVEDDILDTWLVFCHHCLYITHDFRNIPDQTGLIREFISSEDYRSYFNDTNPTTFELFERYMLMLEGVKASPMVFADTCLRISWLFEDDEDMANAKLYREKAIAYFAKSLLSDHLEEKDKSMAYYYIAELSRRNGNFDRARKSLLKMDTGIPMFQRLFDFQTALIRDHNDAATVMPREESQYDDQLS